MRVVAPLALRDGDEEELRRLSSARVVAGGVAALTDTVRAGRPRSVDEVEIVVRTLVRPPQRIGVTHWSPRLLAKELGVAASTPVEAWQSYGLQPWRTEGFKFSTDPQLEAKIRDVVGLYLHPPEGAIVLGADEKSQCQALRRSQPILPMRPGIPNSRPTTTSAWHHAIRRARGRHRQGGRRLLPAAPQPGVPQVPRQTGRRGLASWRNRARWRSGPTTSTASSRVPGCARPSA